MFNEIKIFFKGFFEKRITMLFLGTGVMIIVTAFNDHWLIFIREFLNQYLNTSFTTDTKDTYFFVIQLFVGLFFIILGIIFYLKFVRKDLVKKKVELSNLMRDYKKEMLARFNKLCYPNRVEELKHLESLTNEYSEIFNKNKRLYRYYQNNMVLVFKAIDEKSKTIQEYKQRLEGYKTPVGDINDKIDKKYFNLKSNIDELIKEQESKRDDIKEFEEFINKIIKKI